MFVTLAFSFIALSELPLTVSVVLLSLLGNLVRERDVLLPAMQGEVEFSSAREFKTPQGRVEVRSVNFVLMALGLVITRSDNQREILWRDSVDEASYRQLVVMLKREH